jgi:hypothetical protein
MPLHHVRPLPPDREPRPDIDGRASVVLAHVVQPGVVSRLACMPLASPPAAYGENGLLLTPSIDHLFDRGFIAFEDNGRLVISPVAHRPSLERMGIETRRPVNVGGFTSAQKAFLEFQECCPASGHPSAVKTRPVTTPCHKKSPAPRRGFLFRPDGLPRVE